MEVSKLVAELSRPTAYASASARVPMVVEVRQTHISLLFFLDERVYKVKKPVHLGFLDFSSLARRKHYCEEEVRLNRRLAPSVYLGVVPIALAAGGGMHVAGEGEPVEWAVEMVRLPDRDMLDQKLERGEIDNDLIRRLVALLVDFHADAATGPDVDEFGMPGMIQASVDENFEQLQPFIGAGSSVAAVLSCDQWLFLRKHQLRFLHEKRPLLERRVREGRIREGHGDLHAGNICCRGDQFLAYDCIEFNRRFRCCDVAADIAFLAMDLERLGYSGAAQYFVRQYARAADDTELSELVPFYKQYRAIVRGKVAALRAVDPGLPAHEHENARLESMRYLQLAVGYGVAPTMILMCGLPASGKSWLARYIARPLRAGLLQSDVRRKVLAGIPSTRRTPQDYEAGLYAPERKRETYRSLMGKAVDVLRSGRTVIVDASFSKRAFRAAFVDAATRLGMPYLVVNVTASDELTHHRMSQRAAEARQSSDADWTVYVRAKERFEPPREIDTRHVLEVDSAVAAPESATARVLDRLVAL